MFFPPLCPFVCVAKVGNLDERHSKCDLDKILNLISMELRNVCDKLKHFKFIEKC